MADFVAVLTKTLSGLDNPTPEMREKVYAKARTTISAKLAAISPPPAAAVIDKQKEALEKAIADIEAGYAQSAPAPTADEDPLAEFVSGKAFGTTLAPAPTIKPVEPAEQTTLDPTPEPAKPEAPTPVEETPAEEAAKQAEAVAKTVADSQTAEAAKPARKGRGGLIAAVIVLLLLAGAGYAVWENKEDFARMAGLEHLLPGAENAPAPAVQEAADQNTAADSSGQDQAAADTTQNADNNQEAADTSAGQDEPEETKFTQRLMADGTEVDAGPAGGEASIGEGTSVATANNANDGQAGDGEQQATAAGSEASGESTDQTGAEAPADTALPVGQRAIFYEERTNDLQGSAEPGAVVWSLVEESPGGNLPPEAAIRAEASIPGKELQFRMTIRRNGDESLPASHIIEMIFITPDNFEGGGIENVLRITFKDTEQSTGNPLLGIPAKISDGFFLLALTDSKADIEANSTMMRRLDWLDVPIVYSSGRRALITMEKGVPGSKVFEEALKAWAPESSG